MITALPYTITQETYNKLLESIPEFDHRLVLNEPSSNFFYDSWTIKKEFCNTALSEALECLPFDIGEARLMRLKPGKAYYSHADIDDRFHLNISGIESYLIDLNSKIMHPTYNDNTWYEMDAGIKHSAVNFGNIDRIQLVVRKLLNKNKLNNSVLVSIILEEFRHDYRYVFDKTFSPWINRAIKQGTVNNFSLKDDQVYFEIEEQLLNEIEKITPKGFKIKCQ